MPDGKSLLERINEHLASDELRLPVYSPVAARLQAVAADPEAPIEQIEQVLQQDMGLASQVLRVANSSFYCGLSKAATVGAAIQRLGLTQVVNLAVMCAQREQFRSDDALVAGYIDRLWRHAVTSAFGAQWLAQRCGWRELAAEAFMAALLHDIGALLLLKVIEQLRAADAGERVPEPLVMEVIEALHEEQGGRLIEAWRLPESYAQVARAHHGADINSAGTLGVIVRLADRACDKLGFALAAGGARGGVVLSASPEAAALGLTEIALAELEIFLEDTIAPLAA